MNFPGTGNRGENSVLGCRAPHGATRFGRVLAERGLGGRTGPAAAARNRHSHPGERFHLPINAKSANFPGRVKDFRRFFGKGFGNRRNFHLAISVIPL